MTRQQAIEKLVRHRRNAEKTIAVIMLWDEKKTLTENSRRIGLFKQTAYAFAKRYSLKFKRDKRGLHRTSGSVLKKRIVDLLRSPRHRWTYEQIGDVLGISRQRVEQIYRG